MRELEICGSVTVCYSAVMDKKMVHTVADWELVAKDFLMSLSTVDTASAVVVVLSGDLGAGKTTFVKAIADQLKVDEPVTSPTFTILKRYEVEHDMFTFLLHMDAYRLESAAELQPLHFDELLHTPNTLFVIEWGERITNALPERTMWYVLNVETDGTHTIQLGRKE